MRFARWLEARVSGSMAGEAMKRTLDFKVDAEWIKWGVEKKGWISDGGTKDSFDLSAAFYNPKVPKPAFFYVRANAILERPDAEYDSVAGGGEMEIRASIYLFNGKTGLGGVLGSEPRSMKGLLERHGHVKLSERGDRSKVGSHWPGFISELDGPSLRTPLQLADWINKVIEHTDLGMDDEGDDDGPENPQVPNPAGGSLVGV